MPEKRQQNDDRDRNAKQPEKNASTHDVLLYIGRGTRFTIRGVPSLFARATGRKEFAGSLARPVKFFIAPPHKKPGQGRAFYSHRGVEKLLLGLLARLLVALLATLPRLLRLLAGLLLGPALLAALLAALILLAALVRIIH
jgi:hypothetical protein